MQHTAIYFRSSQNRPEIHPQLHGELRPLMEAAGDTVVATFVDDDQIMGRGRYARWRELLACLDRLDRVVVRSAGDLPGKTIADLLRLLANLRDHNVSLCLHREGYDTSQSAAFAILDIIDSYRNAKLSQAIRRGQARATLAGRLTGRPRVNHSVVARIQAALREGAGIRTTARKFGVSPATVINIRSAAATPEKSRDSNDR
jgi:DNA invertase Pin-like site-specific DNA recombinase